MDDQLDEPYPGYVYDGVAAARADKLLTAVRRTTLQQAEGGLFDTEPALIEKTMAAYAQDRS